MGSSYNLWRKRLTGSDTLTRGQIRQFCNAVVAGSRGGFIGGARTNLTHEECGELETLFDNRVVVLGGFKLERGHTEFGFEWLTRDPRRALSLGVTPEHLETFEGFRFIRGEVVSNNGWRALVVPVYRVLSGAGTIEYWWSPWQVGAYS